MNSPRDARSLSDPVQQTQLDSIHTVPSPLPNSMVTEDSCHLDNIPQSPKALITTVPFGEQNPLPMKLLNSAKIDFEINPFRRKIREHELAEMVSDFDVIIAGTEQIGSKVFAHANKLKFISRVGIGLDGIDLSEAKKRNVKISYTPDAPAPAVAELTIAMMLTLLRKMQIANLMMHENKWQRLYGKRISETTIGIIGVGRIGSRVLRSLAAFGSPRILANDLRPIKDVPTPLKLEWVDKQTLLEESDVISIHVPLTCQTRNMIRRQQLEIMKPDAVIINTSRGGIINEDDLASVLAEGHLSGAGIDVFEQEPYSGALQQFERCLLSSHMGSMSIDCRSQMEIEATQEAIRFVKGQALKNPVPETEYFIQNKSLLS